MKEKTHKKLNISLPKELHAWVLKRQAEENRKSRLSKTAISTIIAYAVEQAKIRDDNDKLLMQEHHASERRDCANYPTLLSYHSCKKTRGK
jgi:phage/plasmid-associated DNA primase